MILGLEFPPISHVVEWPVGPLGINKVVVLMWFSTLIAIGVMWLGGRKKALVPTGIQNVAESAVDFVEEGIVLQTIGPDGLEADHAVPHHAVHLHPQLQHLGPRAPARRCR